MESSTSKEMKRKPFSFYTHACLFFVQVALVDNHMEWPLFVAEYSSSIG